MPRSTRSARSALVSLAVLVAACAVTAPREAEAGEPPPETASGKSACDEFEAKNERELKAFVAQQQATAYKYPTPDTVLTAPWGPFFKWFGGNVDLVLATVVPSFGAQIRGQTPTTVLSWPLTFPIGPYYACSRKVGSFNVSGHKIHRFMLEPGLVAGSDLGAGFYARGGYRFLYHPADWVVGPGAGVGSTFELGMKEPKRFSVSPELLVQFGHCCDPGYFILYFRREFFFEGVNKAVWQASLGYTWM